MITSYTAFSVRYTYSVSLSADFLNKSFWILRHADVNRVFCKGLQQHLHDIGKTEPQLLRFTKNNFSKCRLQSNGGNIFGHAFMV